MTNVTISWANQCKHVFIRPQITEHIQLIKFPPKKSFKTLQKVLLEVTTCQRTQITALKRDHSTLKHCSQQRKTLIVTLVFTCTTKENIYISERSKPKESHMSEWVRKKSKPCQIEQELGLASSGLSVPSRLRFPSNTSRSSISCTAQTSPLSTIFCPQKIREQTQNRNQESQKFRQNKRDRRIYDGNRRFTDLRWRRERDEGGTVGSIAKDFCLARWIQKLGLLYPSFCRQLFILKSKTKKNKMRINPN